MIILAASVGDGGKNSLPDVRAVQVALNTSGVILGPVLLRETGFCDEVTIWGIKQFQQRHLSPVLLPSGLIVPGDATHKTLEAVVERPVRVAAPTNLSGKDWWHANQASYPNSASVSDLDAGFRAKVEDFLKALADANATVIVAATRRNATRAYLMHWSYKLANGKVKAKDVPAREGCDIVWDHDDEKASRAAAKDMVDLFDIVYQPSLTSLHIKGLAIDMNISWAGTMKIVDAKGVTREIGAPRSGAANDALHKVGASYGVRKLLSDKPHWSSTGH